MAIKKVAANRRTLNGGCSYFTLWIYKSCPLFITLCRHNIIIHIRSGSVENTVRIAYRN